MKAVLELDLHKNHSAISFAGAGWVIMATVFAGSFTGANYPKKRGITIDFNVFVRDIIIRGGNLFIYVGFTIYLRGF